MRTQWAVGLGLAVCVTLASPRAWAYTIESTLSSGCHERITTDALRAVRLDVPEARPLPPTHEEQALIEDLEFVPAADMKDLGGATLLIGVRDNDLKGRGSTDLSQLAEVHGDPNAQREHCLRGPEDLEPNGSATALASCRAFIMERVSDALDGLDANGAVDLTKVTVLPLTLAMRGKVQATLPTFYVRIGQAIHTVEDSYTHTYRSADGSEVTAVLNWLQIVEGKVDEARNGPPHLAGLDRCDDPDDTRKVRRERATAAAAAILRSALDSSATRDDKLAQVDAILTQNLGYAPGCTADNKWCNAPEAADTTSGRGCDAHGCPDVLLGLTLVLLIVKRARRAAIIAVVLGSASIASAQVPTAASLPDSDAHSSAVAPYKMAYGVYGAVAGAFDRPALAAQLGFRLRLTRHWAVGVDGEWNPWIALSGRTVRAGAVNIYATAILRVPLSWESFNLRTTANVGVSYLLTDLYGAPAGSVGLFLGVSPLGVEWKVAPFVYLIFNPLGIAVPIPQLQGVPFMYPQYRITIGIEFSTVDSPSKPTLSQTMRNAQSMRSD